MIRKYLATGTTISFVASAALTLILAYSTKTSTQVSVLVGLLSALIGLTVTALFTLTERLEQIDRARITVASLQRLSEVSHLEKPIVSIVESCADTQAKRTPFMHNRVSEALRRFSDEVENMANGLFVCRTSEEELRLVKAALAETEKTVRAVASRGLEWWKKTEADVYFKAYAVDAKRLRVCRIFLLRPDQLEEARPVLDRHAAAGIETYAVDIDLVPEERRRGLVLFDNTLLHRHAPRREGSELRNVEFTDVSDDILEAQDDFNVVMDLASDPARTLYSSHNPPGRRRWLNGLGDRLRARRAPAAPQPG